MSGLTNPSSEKPTILFIHGAWDDGSAWDIVCNSLSKQGYSTVAPSLPSPESRPPASSHLEDANFIRQELRILVHEQNKEVIVVGHSYGGFVAIESIRGFGKHETGQGGVLHCPVMSAFVGCKGESVMSILDNEIQEFLGVDVSMTPVFSYNPFQADIRVVQPENPDYVIVRGAEMAFFNDVDPSVAASRLGTAAPHPYATFLSKIQNPCRSPPSERNDDRKVVSLTYLICTNDQGIPEGLQPRMITTTADVEGAKWRVWKRNAGYNPATSQADTVSVAVRKVV